MRAIFICFVAAAIFSIQATAKATTARTTDKTTPQAKAKSNIDSSNTNSSDNDNDPKTGKFAIGFSLGTNSSISGKFWFNSEAAVDLGVENSTSPWKVYYADFLWHFPKLFGSSSRFARETVLYVGAGVGGGHWQRSEDCGRWNCSWSSTTTGSGTAVFARVVLGMEWYPAKAERLGVYGEIAPSYLLYPSGRTFDEAVGARYYF